MAQLTITIDDRVRLLTAVLAAGTWPGREQAQEKHAVHAHSKQTQHFVRPFAAHPAVAQTDTLLAEGVGLDVLASAALRCRWPDFVPMSPLPEGTAWGAWPAALADFAQATAIATAHWQPHQAVWQEAVDDLTAVFAEAPLLPLLARLRVDPLPPDVQVMPALVTPMLSPVLATAPNTWLLLLPPPKAVGESPPWPFREDPAWVVAQTCERLVAYLLAGALASFASEERETVVRAAVSICLQRAFDEMEAMAYVVRSKKAYKLPRLPLVAQRLEDALAQSSRPPSWAALLAA